MLNLTDATEFCQNIYNNTYGNSNVNVRPFTANMQQILQTILPSRTAFFGNLTINTTALFYKTPFQLNSALGQDIFLSLNSVPQLFINCFGNASSSVYQNMVQLNDIFLTI